MALGDALDELPQRMEDIGERLAGGRLQGEDEETGWPSCKAMPTSDSAFEATYAWPMARTGSITTDRRFRLIEALFETNITGPGYTEQNRIGRNCWATGGHREEFVVEVEQRRFGGSLMRDHVIGTLPEAYPKKGSCAQTIFVSRFFPYGVLSDCRRSPVSTARFSRRWSVDRVRRGQLACASRKKRTFAELTWNHSRVLDRSITPSAHLLASSGIGSARLQLSCSPCLADLYVAFARAAGTDLAA